MSKVQKNRAARRAAKKRAAVKKGGRSVEVLVDRIALPVHAVLDNDDPIGVVLAQLDDALRAFDVAGADLFDETSIRFGRHPAPAFKGEVVIEIQSVRPKAKTFLSIVKPFVEGEAAVDQSVAGLIAYQSIDEGPEPEDIQDEKAVAPPETRCLFVSRAKNTSGARCVLDGGHDGRHDLED